MPSTSKTPDPPHGPDDPACMDPFTQVINAVEKKIRNLSKRKSKLENYKDAKTNGKSLDNDQEEALSRYDAVLHNLDFARELKEQFVSMREEAKTVLKKQQKEQQKEQQKQKQPVPLHCQQTPQETQQQLQQSRSQAEMVAELLSLQNLLDCMGDCEVRADFASGTSGALHLSEENLNQLDEFYQLISSVSEDGYDYDRQLRSAADHLVKFLDCTEMEVAGTTYKDLNCLVKRIKECGYSFNNKCVANREDDKNVTAYQDNCAAYQQNVTPCHENGVAYEQNADTVKQNVATYQPNEIAHQQNAFACPQNVAAYQVNGAAYGQNVVNCEQQEGAYQDKGSIYQENVTGYQQNVDAYQENIAAYLLNGAAQRQSSAVHQQKSGTHQENNAACQQNSAAYQQDGSLRDTSQQDQLVLVVRDLLELQSLLDRLGMEEVRSDFVAGASGAFHLAEENLKQLDEWYQLITPASEDAVDHIVHFLSGSQREVAGTTYTDLKSLVKSIYECGYFGQTCAVFQKNHNVCEKTRHQLRDLLVLQGVLQNMGEEARLDFANGTYGALYLSEENLNQLDELYHLTSPVSEDGIRRVNAALDHVVNFLDGNKNQVAGTTYEDLKSLVKRIHDCRYFEKYKSIRISKTRDSVVLKHLLDMMGVEEVRYHFALGSSRAIKLSEDNFNQLDELYKLISPFGNKIDVALDHIVNFLESSEKEVARISYKELKSLIKSINKCGYFGETHAVFQESRTVCEEAKEQLRDLLVMWDVLESMGADEVRAEFESGTSGALHLSEEILHQLDEFYGLISPVGEDGCNQLDAALDHIMNYLAAKEKAVAGTTYKELNKLVKSIHHSDYFLKKNIPLRMEGKHMNSAGNPVNDSALIENGNAAMHHGYGPVFIHAGNAGPDKGKGAKEKHKQQQLQDNLRELLVLKVLLDDMGFEKVRIDFLTGMSGALHLSGQNLNQLDELYQLIRPVTEDGMNQLDAAHSHIVNLLDGSEKEVAGTTYKDLKYLVKRICECGYFGQTCAVFGKNHVICEKTKHQLLEVLVLQGVLENIGVEEVRSDFGAGLSGALHLSEENLNHLDEFYKLINPISEDGTNQIDVALEHIVNYLDARDKVVVDTTYKKLNFLVKNINGCGYFGQNNDVSNVEKGHTNKANGPVCIAHEDKEHDINTSYGPVLILNNGIDLRNDSLHPGNVYQEIQRKQQQLQEHLREFLALKSLLDVMGAEEVRSDFADGSSGALHLSEETLNQLDVLYQLIRPVNDDGSNRLDDALENIVYFLESNEKTVARTTYKDLKSVVKRINECSYFGKTCVAFQTSRTVCEKTKQQLRELLVLQGVLENMGAEQVRADFAAGLSGAIHLLEENLNQLDEFYQLINPISEDGINQLDVALEHIVNYLDARDKVVVGTTYKELNFLVKRINGCGYFGQNNGVANAEEEHTNKAKGPVFIAYNGKEHDIINMGNGRVLISTGGSDLRNDSLHPGNVYQEIPQKQQQLQEHLREFLALKSLLDVMGAEEVRSDFAAGSSGALHLSEETLNQLDELYQLIRPVNDDGSNRLDDAQQHIVYFLESNEKEVARTTYKDLKSVVKRINECGYFGPTCAVFQTSRTVREKTKHQLRELLVLQGVLENMGVEQVRSDFAAGLSGALPMSEDNLKQLDDFYQLINPISEDGTNQLDVALEHIVNYLDARDKVVVGTTYKELNFLVERINGCGYFGQNNEAANIQEEHTNKANGAYGGKEHGIMNMGNGPVLISNGGSDQRNGSLHPGNVYQEIPQKLQQLQEHLREFLALKSLLDVMGAEEVRSDFAAGSSGALHLSEETLNQLDELYQLIRPVNDDGRNRLDDALEHIVYFLESYEKEVARTTYKDLKSVVKRINECVYFGKTCAVFQNNHNLCEKTRHQLRELLVLQVVLENMGAEEVRADFAAGTSGAVLMSENNLNQLDEWYQLISPFREGGSNFEDQLNAAVGHVVNYLNASDDEIAGTTYRELKALVKVINECGYFGHPNVEAVGKEGSTECASYEGNGTNYVEKDAECTVQAAEYAYPRNVLQDKMDQQQQIQDHVIDLLVLKNLLDSMGVEKMRSDFATGSSGALHLPEENLNQLDELYQLISPVNDDWSSQLDTALGHIVKFLSGSQMEVAGTTYKDLRTLAKRINECGYFGETLSVYQNNHAVCEKSKKTLRDFLVLQGVLDSMGVEEIRSDFAAGASGALHLSADNLNQLDELYQLITPIREDRNDHPNQLKDAAYHILNFLEASDHEALGTTYNALNNLIKRIHGCGYFGLKNGVANGEGVQMSGDADHGSNRKNQENSGVDVDNGSVLVGNCGSDNGKSVTNQENGPVVIATSAAEVTRRPSGSWGASTTVLTKLKRGADYGKGHGFEGNSSTDPENRGSNLSNGAYGELTTYTNRGSIAAGPSTIPWAAVTAGSSKSNISTEYDNSASHRPSGPWAVPAASSSTGNDSMDKDCSHIDAHAWPVLDKANASRDKGKGAKRRGNGLADAGSTANKCSYQSTGTWAATVQGSSRGSGGPGLEKGSSGVSAWSASAPGLTKVRQAWK